ncbi:hypothetical protein BJV78DRAFT_409510 [Lactifluus subvellereus]|nr:hypothetical protein BJV78DRAFT_409510 [Lactifluus subvellereus]
MSNPTDLPVLSNVNVFLSPPTRYAPPYALHVRPPSHLPQASLLKAQTRPVPDPTCPSHIRFRRGCLANHDVLPKPERSREPEAGAAPPSYEQIIMGLHLSRTPHIPAHLAHLYPPAPQSIRHQQQQQQQQQSSPTSTSISSSAPPSRRTHKARSHPHPLPSSSSTSSSRVRARLPPPPARSAMKKPRVTSRSTTTSSMTPDTASASTVASSVHSSTPTRPGLLARFLGAKERGAASSSLVVVIAEHESGPERKAVRFGGVEEEEEDES